MIMLVVLAAAAAVAAALNYDYASATGSGTLPAANPSSAVFFPSGNLAVGFVGDDSLRLLDASLTELDSVNAGVDPRLRRHPDGEAVVMWSDGLVRKYSENGAFQMTATLTPTGCTAPTWVALQQTGSQRMFFSCGTAVCQTDADLTGESCTVHPNVYMIEASPSGAFFVTYDGLARTLTKWTIDNGGGTFSVASEFDVGAAETSTIPSLNNEHMFAITADNRIVLPSGFPNRVLVVNSSFDGLDSVIDTVLSTITGALMLCVGPEAVVTDPTGTGDILLVCDSSNSYIALENDLSSGQAMVPGVTPIAGTSATTGGWVASQDEVPLLLAPGSRHVFWFGPTPALETPTPLPGGGGDPILTDIEGHVFPAGMRPNTDYFLYQSENGADTITMRTGFAIGAEHGYFMSHLFVSRAGCGTLVFKPQGNDHEFELESPECMSSYLLHGDAGIVVYALESGTLAAIAPHHGQGFGFLNIRFLNLTPRFKSGCLGMLCDEKHADALAL